MWKFLGAIAVAVVAAEAAAAPPSALPPPGPSRDLTISAVRGEMEVRDRCSSCHAVGLHDVSPNPASPPLRAVGLRYPVDRLEWAFAEGMRVSHNPAMPTFTLRPEETADIIAYLKELHRQDPSSEMAW